MSVPATRYNIRFLNDDFTPMEFVVSVLEDVFKMTREQAMESMLATHRQGTQGRKVTRLLQGWQRAPECAAGGGGDARHGGASGRLASSEWPACSPGCRA